MHNGEGDSSQGTSVVGDSRQSRQDVNTIGISGWSEYAEYVNTIKSIRSQKSELDEYLEEHVYKANDGSDFDVLDWWRVHALKYKVLSVMAKDILAIPVSTVASQTTFSAGIRVIDDCRASLSTDTLQVLLCGGDWVRHRFGVKKKNKVN